MDFPIENGDFPYIVMLVYQRVNIKQRSQANAENSGTTVTLGCLKIGHAPGVIELILCGVMRVSENCVQYPQVDPSGNF